MSMSDNILYLSLDQARVEIRRRWADEQLRRQVESFLGDFYFAPGFGQDPRGYLPRSILSPDNGYEWFRWCCNYLNLAPIVSEYTGDILLAMNEEKRGLCRLRLSLPDGRQVRVNIIEKGHSEKQRFCDVQTKHGETLVDFHRRLLRQAGQQIEIFDMTTEWQRLGRAPQYYLPYLAHCIVHGVLFENFMMEPDCKEFPFTRDVVLPAMERLNREFGCRPMVVRLYPENQSDAEDRFWWSYPPAINDFIVKYAQEHGYALISEDNNQVVRPLKAKHQ